ncbi:outer membrane protein [Devosia sp. MC521]|uniref:outer membrane protein n=1 Tax=Devosia sp. MC521 TaxID=2759954 RepID=UPI0015F8FEAD|nr:outer membrane protein [Devosia sp. MC521]MBJ6988198.1 porin family protein [Devosia sp. MC521]QMW63477.1 porin family protein [Devosia sp. MC521]
MNHDCIKAAKGFCGRPAYTASGFDWTGMYAGAVGGYVWGRSVAGTTGSAVTTTIDPSGSQIGVTAGVNAQFDQFVLGLEGEVLWSGVKGTGTITNRTDVATIKSEWQGAIKARAGVTFDQVLVYAHGGFAFADYSASVNTGGGVFRGDNRTGRTGWTVGAGVEMAINENVSVKAEYAYSDFGKWTGTVSNGLGSTDFQYHTHAVKAGVNFHF